MKKLSVNEIRQMWLDFFISKGHHFVEPQSLVPVNDPSLLWINSGVATLKPYFDGRKTPPSKRLTNSQKAIRTNDIENVGVTARHQTMFEMLGNFSIGDYFKPEAIDFAWEILTSPEWFAIDPKKIYVTVYKDDQEAYDKWASEKNMDPTHIFKMGRETNFWDVGQGPCGPNTEMFFDRGEEWDPKHIGPRLISDDIENDRYIEIWDIVFSQYNNDGHNNYTELPRKNIDTGAGLERLASIFQGTPTNFETDLFFPTIKETEKMSAGFKYSIENYKTPEPKQTKINTAFKVIADHVRAVAFAIADGVFPGNKDRGYVIRRLIRRGAVYGRNLGINEPFMYKLVHNVVEVMKGFYPYLIPKQQLIEKTIKNEEEKFSTTLVQGQNKLDDIIKNEGKVSAQDALLLFESFGFPIELTAEIAADKNIKVDVDGFHKLMEEVKETSRKSRKDLKAWNKQNELFTKLDVQSEFTGWDEMVHDGSKVVYMFVNDKPVQEAKDGEAFVILDKTPFYAEKGGQAADDGYLYLNDGTKFYVEDVQQGPKGQNIHKVDLKGKTLKVGDVVKAEVNKDKREATMKNHSGTHLVHAALRQVLGKDTMQAGSYNDENGLRLDFSYDGHIDQESIDKVQKIVNDVIAQAIPRETYFTTVEEAVKKYNALAFFGDKYGSTVRVIKFGDFSSELCGGTHVANTADVEDFIITGVESKGSGTFRLHALTSNETVSEYVQKVFDDQKEIVDGLISKYRDNSKTLPDKTLEAKYDEIAKLEPSKDNIEQLKKLAEDFDHLFHEWNKSYEDKMQSQKINKYNDAEPKKNKDGVDEINLEVEGLNIKDLKALADEFRNKYDDIIIVLKSKTANGNFAVVAVSDSLQDKYKAIDIFKALGNTKGGGNAKIAQGKWA